MPIVYKINVMQALKEKGYTPQRMRKEKLFSESTLQKFRENVMVSTQNIATLCKLLEMNVDEIITYIDE